MEATMVGTRERRRVGTTGAVAAIGSIALAVAAVWYVLAVEGITVAREPVFAGHETLAEKFRIYFGWVVLTLPQERLYVSIAILGFACLAVVAVLAMREIAADASLARAGTFAVVLGATLWIVGNLIQLGAHRAVGSMAMSRNPLPTVGAIFFTADRIDDAFETAAFAALGVGMLLLARSRMPSGTRAWGRYTAALGAASLVLTVAYLADEGDAIDVLLLVLGAIALPVWLVWTSTRAAGAHTLVR